MVTYIWIEGEKALHEFCKRLFNDTPRFMESYGRVGTAKVYNASKQVYDADGCFVTCADMYLLLMEVSDNDAMTKNIPNLITSTDLHDRIRHLSYEEIRADKTAILKQRG